MSDRQELIYRCPIPFDGHTGESCTETLNFMLMGKLFDWYAHLVEHSRTDHIYDLIHDELPPDFTPATAPDFIVVDRQIWDLEASFKVEDGHVNHSLRPHKFGIDPGLVFIRSKHLEPYLEEARRMYGVQTPGGKGVVRLDALVPKGAPFGENDELSYKLAGAFEGETGNHLRKVFECLRRCKDKEKALKHARLADGLLQPTTDEVRHGKDANAKFKLSASYHLIALAFAWNGRIAEAMAADRHFLYQSSYRRPMDDIIANYLNLLTVRAHYDHLEKIFSDQDFRKRFFHHYEAYKICYAGPYYPVENEHFAQMVLTRIEKWFGGYAEENV